MLRNSSEHSGWFWAVAQLWLFWVAPIIGGIIGAGINRFIGGMKR
jgi:aquaporin Z